MTLRRADGKLDQRKREEREREKRSLLDGPEKEERLLKELIVPTVSDQAMLTSAA